MTQNFDEIKYARLHDANAYGEIPLHEAPKVQSSHSKAVTPQQYLLYYRTKQTVEAIINEIAFSEHLVLFVNATDEFVYLQVGIIGKENYPPSNNHSDSKIVYGRRWIIEPDMPTSEVVQTAFLALEKAREHELREHVVLTLNDEGSVKGLKKNDAVSNKAINNKTAIKRCTPFNSHIDLPLFCDKSLQLKKLDDYQSVPVDEQIQQLREFFTRVRVAGYDCQLGYSADIHYPTGGHENNWLVEVVLECSSKELSIQEAFPEFKQATIKFISTSLHPSDVLFAFMNALLMHSHQYLVEHFTFKGVARFSQRFDIEKIGRFSRNTRVIADDEKSTAFAQSFDTMSTYIDSNRVPEFNENELGQKQKAIIQNIPDLDGYLPKV